MDMPTASAGPQAASAAQPAPPAARPAPAAARDGRWAVWIIAAAAAGAELAVSARYGYHRDELYFLEAGLHLQLGYVDQPVLTPLLARLEALAFGNTLAGLRVLPALGMGALVLLTAAMSRLLGAGRAGQVLAALASATCLVYLAAMHLMSTTTPSFVLCALTLYLVMRLLASEDPRWWLAIGAAAGLAAAAKWDIFFLAATLAAGFLATPARRLLRSRYLLAGLAIAAALAAPDVIWQAGHGWPQLALFRSLNGDAGSNRASYWLALVLYTGLVHTPVWVTGQAWSLRSASARRFRPVAIASALLLVLIFVLGGKPYYVGALFTFLFAAGSVPLGRWLERGRRPGSAGRRGRRGDRPVRRAEPAVRPARAPGPEPAGLGPGTQLHPGGVGRLAEAGGPGRPRVPRAAPRRARPHRPAGQQLRRGRGDRPLRARLRPPPGLQRAQQLLVLGTAPGRRHDRDRGEHRPGPAAPRVRPGPAGRDVLERPRA